MTTRQGHKRRGKGFETDLMKWFRERGYVTERLALAGSLDEGDLVVKFPGAEGVLIVEAKAPGRDGKIDLSGWRKEVQREVVNYANARNLPVEMVRGLVVIKAIGKSLDEAYVVDSLSTTFPEVPEAYRQSSQEPLEN